MLKNPNFAAIFTTAYLGVYCAFTQFAATFYIAFCMFLLGPVLMFWLAVTVLKFGKYKGELNEQEFGYQDRENSQLGMFS